jgi:CBS domain-containing protein
LQTEGSAVLNKPMGSLMTASAIFVNKDDLAWDALKRMQKDPKKFVMVLPVLDKDQIVGILHMHSLVQSGIV